MSLSIREIIRHELVKFDQKYQKHNPYAMAHYLAALDLFEVSLEQGLTAEAAILNVFDAPLSTRLIKALNKESNK